jgi:hypothetical protein
MSEYPSFSPIYVSEYPPFMCLNILLSVPFMCLNILSSSSQFHTVSYQIEEDEMGGGCSTNGEEEHV